MADKFATQFKEFLRVLLTNNVKKDGTIVIPYLNKHNIDPIIPAGKIEENLDKLVEWGVKLARDNNAIWGWKDKRIFFRIVREITDDGKGFFVPFWGGYIGKPSQKDAAGNEIGQPPNDSRKDNMGVSIPFYNRDKDTAFIAFLEGLYDHIDHPEEWLTSRKKLQGEKVSDWIAEKNEDGKGIEEAAEPYIESIENLANEQERKTD